MKSYRDEKTGYEIRQYTFGPERNAKLYFSTENFTPDDRYFVFQRMAAGAELPTERPLYRANVETGEIALLADAQYTRFAMHWQENYGVVCRTDGVICRLDIETGAITELGRFPEGTRPNEHLTISNDGHILCSVQLRDGFYALLMLRPGEKEAEIIYITDQNISHGQICPTDSNLVFFVNETGGNALQRTWMLDVKSRTVRPYFVEHPYPDNEWITHETWAADGESMVFMNCPNEIWMGDKDGRRFERIYREEGHILHPGVSRDKQWICTDGVCRRDDGTSCWGVRLVNPRTGKAEMLAYTPNCGLNGWDHAHPSFNRAGDRLIFGAPDENGVAQVCVIDLGQVKRP